MNLSCFVSVLRLSSHCIRCEYFTIWCVLEYGMEQMLTCIFKFSRFIFCYYCWISFSLVVYVFPLECDHWDLFRLISFFFYLCGTCHLNISINNRHTHAIAIVSLFILIVTFIKFFNTQKNYTFPCPYQYFFCVNVICRKSMVESSVRIIFGCELNVIVDLML